MGFVNNNLLLFLNNNLNSLYVLDSSYKMTSQIYSFFEKLKSINDYDDYIRNFPIYNVKNFKPITKLKFNNKSFSTLKIKTCVSNNFDILSNNLIKNVLPTKSETDNYLNDKELIEFTTSLQNIILDDNINKNLLELNGSKIKTDYDYLFNILNNDNIPIYDESKNSNQMEYCLIYYIALYLFVNNNTSFYTNLINLINSENKLNNNLVSFPLKEQAELQKRMIYFYLVLQLLGVFAAIFILYIQTQTKPNKKIKLGNVQNRAKRQAGQLYNTTWNLSEGIGKRALNVADRGTNYGIRQGRRASNNLLKFMFGEQTKK